MVRGVATCLVVASKFCHENLQLIGLESKVNAVKFVFELFPEIWHVFRDNFEKTTPTELIKNPLIYYCLPSNVLELKVSVNALILLKQLNEGLKIVKEKCPNSTVFRRFISTSAEEFHGVIEEILAMYVLARTFGKENVIPYPKLSSGKEADLMVRFNDTYVYIEIGSLGARLSEKRIEKVFNEVAEWICVKLRQYNRNLCLRIEIDTTEIPLKENHIDEDRTFKAIKRELECLELGELLRLDWRGLLNLKVALQVIDIDPKILNQLDRELAKADNPQVRDWIKKKKDILKSLKFVKSIEYYNSRTLVVEVWSDESYPSKLSERLLEAVAKQIIRHLKEQAVQTESDCANIIAIDTRHWSLLPTDGLEVFFKETLFKHLEGELMSVFMKSTDISGVILFFDTIDHGVFIRNPIAKTTVDWFVNSLKLKEIQKTTVSSRYSHLPTETHKLRLSRRRWWQRWLRLRRRL
jgi:hypothetical protein